MLKRTFTYVDYDGVERTEDCYFNLNKAEVAEMELSFEGGLAKYLNKISEAKNGKAIMEKFKWLILKAYGEKSADGRRFMKSDEISRSFAETEMYNILFMELVTDAKKASDFVAAILPPVDADKPNIAAVPANN